MKKILPLLVLAALVLSACSSATPKPLVSTPTSKPAVTATTAPTVPAAAPTVTPLPGGCQPAALLPDPDPAFPAITKDDWAKGPETASVTILEYSDFQ